MKHLVFIFWITFFSTEVLAQFQIDKIISVEKNQNKRSLKSPTAQTGTNIDIVYYRLNLKLNSSVKKVDGSVCVYFRAKTNNVRTISLNLSSQLTVDSIIQNNTPILTRHSNDLLNFDLISNINTNQLDSVIIYYHGIPNPANNGFGTFTVDSYNGTDSVLWTLSQPYGASAWWPCKEGLRDKADSVEVIVTSPLGQKVASNGLLLHIDSTLNSNTYHWKSTYPIPAYLIAVAVSNYNIVEDKQPLGNDSIYFQHFLYPNDPNSVRASLQETYPFMVLFDSLFGPYPFIKEKYGHASCNFGGGMEHQTMSFMGSYGGELNAHELAHQWFGNKVTCNSWQDIWLNEGFATYLTYLTYEFNVVHNSLYTRAYLNGMRNASFNNVHGSVHVTDTNIVSQIFNAMTYQKGAAVLHMLRYLVGDSSFFAACRNYLNDPQLAYGFASTTDLKNHMEASSGMNLTEFFNDWFYGKGYPTYNINWSYQAGLFQINFIQFQSHPSSVPYFDIPIPLKLENANWDTTIYLSPSINQSSFSIPISQNVKVLTFDPELQILARVGVITHTDEIIAIQSKSLTVYPNPASNHLTVQIPKEELLKHLTVFDSNGDILLESELNELKIEGLPQAIYFLKIETNSSTYYSKFIKKD
tara:strand:+ start:8992 stop:10911 length:1920 start_codon:yes stop_codon:yes gene_type:complete